MKGSKKDLINYRLDRAQETYEDALILRERGKWNSIVNRLYYAAFYAVSALLLDSDLQPTTHTGSKSNFSEYFIKSGKVDKKYGKIYSQLFSWRQKGDYADLFDFDKEIVDPYFLPVKEFIDLIIEILEKSPGANTA
ncbi:HEPN domain-containing protein [Bacteroidota bacterium]